MSESPTRREYLKYVGAASSSAAVTSLAGCAGGEGNDTTTGGTTTEGSGDGDTTTETETPAEDVNLLDEAFTHINVGYVTPYDPAADRGWVGNVIQGNLYDSLLAMDPDSLEPSAHIATEWTTENSGKTWVFTIREGVPLQHGGTLDANDVAYSMKRLMALEMGKHSLWQGFINPDNIEVRDDRTVAFNLKKPYGLMLPTFVNFLIVDAETIKKNAKDKWGTGFLKSESAGSGPYTLTEAKEEEVVFDAFEDYWRGWQNDQFGRARYQFVSETSTIQNMMKRGTATQVSSWLAPDSYDFFRNLNDVTVHSADSWRTLHVEMNTRKPPLDDKNVRKALAYATDYQGVLKNVYGGSKQLVGPIPSSMPGYNKNLTPYKQDLDKAQKALEQSDYTVQEINDIGIKQVWNSVLPYTRLSALALQENFKELGINVELSSQNFPTLLERNQDPETTPHMQWLFQTARTPSPDSLLYRMFHRDALDRGGTGTWYTTDEITNMLEKARVTVNEEERLGIYQKIQRKIQQAYPTIPVAEYKVHYPTQSNVEGFTFRGLDGKEVRFHDYHKTG